MSTPSPTFLTRRRFVGSAAAGAGFLLLRSGLRAGASAPSNKLNIALIGITGRGRVFHEPLSSENVVALCDINETFFPEVLKKFPKAKTHVDWRKCIEQKDVDAVVVCTADHTHAFITNWAMNRDKHVYCEKPLAITVEEVRLIRSKWQAKRGKLASQVGTGTGANHNRIRELVHDGAIGDLRLGYAWGTRIIKRHGYWPAEGAPPPGFHYDLWLGPSPHHPYNPNYFKPGTYTPPGHEKPVNAANAGCLSWNMFRDFGAGQIGDMGSHNMNMVWNALDGTTPVAIEAKGDPFNPEVHAVQLEAHFDHPANDWRGPVTVMWHQGGLMPRSPLPYVDLTKIRDGMMFKGTQGFVVGDFRTQSRVVLPFGEAANLSYYQPRPKEKMTPTYNGITRWIEACKNPSLNTPCDFEYGSYMMEQNLLGLVAHQAGRRITYDGARGVITDYPAANAYLKKEYRKGWALEG